MLREEYRRDCERVFYCPYNPFTFEEIDSGGGQ
jgi:hypothetical protein